MLGALSTFFLEYKLKILNKIDISGKIFSPEIIKSGKSNLNLVLIDFYNQEPLIFIKLYFTKPFTCNRSKRTLKIINFLEELKVPFIKPLGVFYMFPFKAYLKNKLFYGGTIYPFIKTGFITERKIVEFKENGNYKKFLNELVKFLFMLHEKGIYLRDTKYNNFWYDEERTLIRIFDLDGIKFYFKPLNKKLRLKDLSTLAMSLEWTLETSEERNIIFMLYQQYYAYIRNEDFLNFEKYIKKRLFKRQKSYLR